MKMIVVGGSAGGLPPLKTILRDLPTDLDAAVLVLRHSWPTIPSHLATLLHPISALPVREIEAGTTAEAGHVYVAPSGVNVTVKGPGGTSDADADGGPERAVFGLEPCEPNQKGRPSIDVSMISAARTFGTDCIGVILSGYLDDGTQGAIEVGACEGVIIVQAPSDAEQASMPLNVIVRDSPDYVLPDIQIAGTLRDLVRGTADAYEDVSYA